MRRVLRWIGMSIGGVVALVVLALGAGYAISEVRMRRTHVVASEPPVAVASDSAATARGRHLAVAITKCVDCHGDGLQGRTMIDDPVLGRLSAANLTRGAGGIGAQLTDVDIERAVRHGVGRSGRSLLGMPSVDYQSLSDADLAAIIAYVRSVTPHDNLPEPTRIKPVARLLLAAGKLPFLSAERAEGRPRSPVVATPGPTPEYGRYIADVGGCTGCHGPTLSGGHIDDGDPKWPPAANLTPAGNLGRWTEAQFVHTLRTGHRPDGSSLNDAMPWRLAGEMTDDEMHAVWLYLRGVPAKEYGNH